MRYNKELLIEQGVLTLNNYFKAGLNCTFLNDLKEKTMYKHIYVLVSGCLRISKTVFCDGIAIHLTAGAYTSVTTKLRCYVPY